MSPLLTIMFMLTPPQWGGGKRIYPVDASHLKNGFYALADMVKGQEDNTDQSRRGRLMQCVPLKCWYCHTRLCGVSSEETVCLVLTTV
jgi:hypothetical protein